jgi:CHAT domain-containing protein/Tfp pilus assembly protein PilF
MVPKPEAEEQIRIYLLGEVTEDERQKFEERLMIDDELVDQLVLIEDELIDDYVLGTLSERERELFDHNFLTTPDRKQKLILAERLRNYAVTTENAREEKTGSDPQISEWIRSFLGQGGKVAAFALILLIAGLVSWRLFFVKTPVNEALASLNQVYRHGRPVEPRITGFSYADFKSSEQRGNKTELNEEVDYIALERARSYLFSAHVNESDPSVLHALGKFYLTQKEFDKAIEQFEAAVKISAQNSEFHSDLGAAFMEKGKTVTQPDDTGQRFELFAKSLEHLNKALELNNSLPEALFNRALCHNYLGITQAAVTDWRKYLEIDSRSGWAEEAKQRLDSLEERQKRSRQSREQTLEDYLHAWRTGDHEKARELAWQQREIAAGKLISEQLATAYINARRHGQPEAVSWLEALSSLGEWELQGFDDHYISGLADFYRRLNARQTELLFQGQQAFDQGREHYLAARYDEAVKSFALAREKFKQGGDYWEERFAAYLMSICYLQTGQTKESLMLLEQLIRECKREKHQWLLARALASTGRALAGYQDYSRSIEYWNQCLVISERIKDTYNVQKNLAQLAYQYSQIGNHRRALTLLERALKTAEERWPDARQMWRTYDTAALVFTAVNLPGAAAAYELEALHLATDQIKDPSFNYLSYVNLGGIYGKLGRYAEGIQYAERGLEIAQAMPDRAAGRVMSAKSLLQLAHLYLESGNYREASKCYDDALTLCRQLEDIKWMNYDIHKGRFLCYLGQGNETLAGEELNAALGLFEKDRSTIFEETSRNTFFNHENIYDLAIDFEYSRKNPEKAFEYAETSRARSLLDMTSAEKRVVANNKEAEIRLEKVSQPLHLSDIQAGMPEETQIIQYSVLADRLLIWILSKSQFEAREQKISREELDSKVGGWLKLISRPSLSAAEEIRRQGQDLYRILITPVEPLLDSGKLICISPDKQLVYLPFGALIKPQSTEPLISRYRIALTPSSTILVDSSTSASQKKNIGEEKLLSVGDPHFDRAAFPLLSFLPASGEEASAIATQYRVAWRMTGEKATEENVKRAMSRAEVIHLASHYVTNSRSPWLSQLLLTAEPPGGGFDGILHAWEIYQTDLRSTRLVVLSACQTGVETYYSGEGAIGAARAFLAAGAPLVIASLWPVDSDSTAELMIDFHSYRRGKSMPTTEALRQAQLKMFKTVRYRQPYYWAAFAAIGGYTTY